MPTLLLLIPLISAFIGWFTNWIAIKMLFHPKEPKRILFFTIQGIFPKRQQQFAEKLGKLVSAELVSFSDIETKLTHPDNLKKLMPLVDNKVDEFLRVKLSDAFPIISMFIGETTIQQLKSVFMNELEEILPELIRKYVRNLESQLDLEKIVIEKVSRFSSDKIESLLNQIMSTEFRFIEIIGGVLGFIIGLIQVVITLISQ
ncbi:MAG: hypothetical protein RIQ50_1056 [Bacteroidota bacterium]|jgi:uncharacterized membrane protein YheB (UPF0754 family)